MAADVAAVGNIGMKLGVDLAGGTSYTDIATLVSMSIEGSSADLGDISPASATDRTYGKGRITPPVLNCVANYDADGDCSKILVTAFRQRLPVPGWQVTYPISASGETPPADPCKGLLFDLGIAIPDGDSMTVSFKIQVSGDSGWAHN